MKRIERDDGHWQSEDYEQRMVNAGWRQLLLRSEDTLIFHGRVRQLKAINLGCGVVAVMKVPLKEATP